jgi:C4-dicarboxylate-specific signal transduction histidine kinase
MGLALSQEIVNAHGGSIEVDPKMTDGCRIRLSLTAVPDDD